MHARAGIVVDILRHVVRRVPIAARVVPQRDQRRRD
jgi:hypothetical protein